jgi:hypothetical protein
MGIECRCLRWRPLRDSPATAWGGGGDCAMPVKRRVRPARMAVEGAVESRCGVGGDAGTHLCAALPRTATLVSGLDGRAHEVSGGRAGQR